MIPKVNRYLYHNHICRFAQHCVFIFLLCESEERLERISALTVSVLRPSTLTPMLVRFPAVPADHFCSGLSRSGGELVAVRGICILRRATRHHLPSTATSYSSACILASTRDSGSGDGDKLVSHDLLPAILD